MKTTLALAVLVGIVRLVMPQRHGFTVPMTFEAIAHIVVGMLIGGWIFCQDKKPYWIALVIISAIEVICAFRP